MNEYLELLWTKLVAEWPRLERRLHSFAVLPSHDVDRPLTTERTWRATIRRAAGDVTLRREPGLALRRMRGFAARARGDNDLDVHNTFDWLMDVSERRDLRSAFYFIAGRRAGRLDADYSLDDPWIRRLLRRIHERGHEVGLHGSYTTPTDAEQLRLEREALARVCAEERIEQERWGGRQHFLRWRNPDTWRAWAAAGLDYDSTVGFADAIGFRAGTCFEYPVFDVVAREPLPLRERPLVAMETAALDRLGLTHEQAADRLAALRDTCRRFGGQFTLLWHNSYLQRRRDREVYEAALG